MIRLAITGPTPGKASSSACVAVLTLTTRPGLSRLRLGLGLPGRRAGLPAGDRRTSGSLTRTHDLPSLTVARDLDRPVQVRPQQRDAPAFEQCQGLGVRVPELIVPPQARHRQSRPHQVEPPRIRPVLAPVVCQLQDRAVPDQVRGPSSPRRPSREPGCRRSGASRTTPCWTRMPIELSFSSPGSSGGWGRTVSSDGAELELAGCIGGEDRLHPAVADELEQAEVVRRGVRGVGGQEDPRPVGLDDLGHAAVMILVVMRNDHQVDRLDAPLPEQLDDVAGRPGVDQGRLALRGADQDRIALADVQDTRSRRCGPGGQVAPGPLPAPRPGPGRR